MTLARVGCLEVMHSGRERAYPPTRRECCQMRPTVLLRLGTLDADRSRDRRIDRRLDEFGHGCSLRDVNRVAARDLGHSRARPRRLPGPD